MDKVYNWLKRPQVWGFFVSMAVMAVISVVYFAPDNFDGNTLQQSDIQQGMANGHEGQVYAEQTGDKALWTNSLFSGMPTFQISPSYPSNDLFTWLNGLYGLWLPSPSNLLFMMMFGFLIMAYCMGLRWYYALIGAVAWGFSSYFMIIIGAGHIWKFLALTYIPPTIGGLILCYRGRYVLGGGLTALFAMLQLNANHPQMTYYFAFVMLGLVVVYLIEAVKSKRLRQFALSTAIVIGAGLIAVGANLPSLYNTYEYAKYTKRAQSELTPAPSADDAKPAARPTGGLPKEEIVGWSYGPSEMMTLLVPNAKGGATIRPERGQPQIMGLDRLDAARSVSSQNQQLLGYFTQYFNDSEGTNGPVYVGALVCALFLLGCLIVRGPMKWCLLILTVLSMLLALGRNFESLTDLMIYHFPMYSKFRAVESILVIAEFTMPLLAILGLVRFMEINASGDGRGEDAPHSQPSAGKRGEDAPHPSRVMRALYISFGVSAALCLLGALVPSVFGSAITSRDMSLFAQMQQQDMPTYEIQQLIEQLRYGMVREDSWRSLMFIGFGFIVLWLYAKRKASRSVVLTVVGLAVLVDLYSADKRYVSHDNFVYTDRYAQSSYDPFAPDAVDQAILADTAQSYRVMDIPGFGDARRSYHHKMVGGYHAAKLNRYEDLIQRRMQHVLGIGYIPELRNDSVAAQYGPEEQEIIRELQADYRVLDMLNARYIVTGQQDYPVLLNDEALGNAWFIDHMKYVTGADDEMAALSTLDPAHEAVADRTFVDALGGTVPTRVPGDTIYLTSYSPNKLTYHANTRNGGVAVFSEVYFPWGWRAEIGDAPVPLARVNYVLRALRVPSGSQTITMTFDPESLHVTGNIAYACVTLIYLWVAAGIFMACTRRRPDGKAAGHVHPQC